MKNLINSSLKDLKESKVVNEDKKSVKESNMGYVRMENTFNDMQDVLDHINDTDLSKSELGFRNGIIELCQNIQQEAIEDLESEDEEDDDDA